LDSKLQPRVSDYGQSIAIDEPYKKSNTAALPWCAPEVLNSQKFSPAADAYSYGILSSITYILSLYHPGVILWELWTGMSPLLFEGMQPIQLANMVAEHGFRFPIPGTFYSHSYCGDGLVVDSCPQKIKELIEWCWDEHTSRPTFFVIIKELQMLTYSI
jgi:serine/threonine protein kinase